MAQSPLPIVGVRCAYRQPTLVRVQRFLPRSVIESTLTNHYCPYTRLKRIESWALKRFKCVGISVFAAFKPWRRLPSKKPFDRLRANGVCEGKPPTKNIARVARVLARGVASAFEAMVK
jgi:hypothetical protein